MLSLRLRQTQTELQWHRAWLTSFKAGKPLSSCRYEQPRFSRSFASGRVLGAELKVRRVGGKKHEAGKDEHIVSAAKQRKQERWLGRRSNTKNVQLENLSTRADLLQAVQERKTKEVIRLYNELPEKRPLADEDFAAVAQWMHQALRLENQARVRNEPTKREDTDEIVAFADQLAKDVRQGNITPSVQANQHILGIFKESRTLDAGKKFWSWLESQDDDSQVRVETYAVAIELHAIAGASLEEMEALYQRALMRFPGSFHAYHLSPEAILPDRERFVPARNIPIGLLQAITQARLMRGDSRNAYLGLDTALRLRPTTLDHRFFRLFLEERPLSEAYTVYAMACQAGYKLPAIVVRNLIDSLRARTSLDDPVSHVAALRTMISVMYLHLGSSGTMIGNTTSTFIISITDLFRLPGIAELEPKTRKKLVDSVLTLVRRALEMFARFGILPSQSVFNAIIVNIAGYGSSKEVLGIAIKDMQALGMKPNDVTRRSVLSVAGIYKDMAFIEKSWEDIVVARRENGEWPVDTDFYVLAKACKQTNSDFAQKQFDAMKTFVPEEKHIAIEHAITKKPEVNDIPALAPVDAQALSSIVAKLNADLDFIGEAGRDGPAMLDFSTLRVPLQLIDLVKLMKQPFDVPEEDMRDIYDSLSTEPTAQSASTVEAGSGLPAEAEAQDFAHLTSPNRANTSSKPSPDGNDLVAPVQDSQLPNRSSTNLTFGELRYRNWKCINYLLKLAEKHDQDYDRIVDEAIAEGSRPPRRKMGFTKQELTCMSGLDMSGPESGGRGKRRDKPEGRAPGRELSKQLTLKEILRLRGRASENDPS